MRKPVTFKLKVINSNKNISRFFAGTKTDNSIFGQDNNTPVSPYKNPLNNKMNNIENPKELGLTRAQADNAEKIATVVIEECTKAGKTPQETKQAVIIALATAMQESTLKNVPYGMGGDFKGLFQQDPGWGTEKQRMDPKYATRKFIKELLKINYMNMSETKAAASVQKCAAKYAGEYQKHVPKAKKITNALLK